ncbi:MAG: hypothetical protein ACI87O_000077 [Planctomycetota bacterium]|jgi:hypothetical protein
MGKIIRIVLLLFVILAGVTVAVFRYKQAFLGKVDTQLQYWYKKPYQDEHNAIKELPMPAGRDEAVRRLEESLDDLEGTRLGDNRFPIWRSMTQMLSDHYMELGAHDKAAKLLKKALKIDPNNLEMRSDLVSSLASIGTIDSLKSAQEHLDFIGYRFPNWSVVAGLELELALQAHDGKAIASALQKSKAHVREELMDNWQVFLFPSNGAHVGSPLVKAVQDQEGELVRAKFELEAPEGGLARFRLDPPTKQSGIVRDWGVVLRDGNGQELVRETARWASALRTDVHADGALQLTGKADPQWILTFNEPLDSTPSLTVEFWFRPDSSVPTKVEEALLDPQVREDFNAQMAKIHGSGGKDS